MWVAGVVLALSLGWFYHTYNSVYKWERNIWRQGGNNNVYIENVKKDDSDTHIYMQGARGDFSSLKDPRGLPRWTYPKFAAICFKPLLWLSNALSGWIRWPAWPADLWALILNHIVLSVSLAWMAWKVIPLPGGWLVAIAGWMAGTYSLWYGNVYPLLCALSMTFAGSWISILWKPYMAVFTVLHLTRPNYSRTARIGIGIGAAGLALAVYSMCAPGITHSLFNEEPNEFFIHKRQFIMIFPAYYLLWRYIPKSWFERSDAGPA